MERIAQVLKSNGVEGELLVSFVNFDPEDIVLEEPVFVEFDGLPVPFFFESFTRRGVSRALVRLTGVRSKEDAEEMVGRSLLLPEESFEDDPESLRECLLDGDLSPIEGWSVIDESSGATVGTISGYEAIPGNPCIYVQTKKEEALLPFNGELLLSLDPDARTVTLRIPEGLISA